MQELTDQDDFLDAMSEQARKPVVLAAYIGGRPWICVAAGRMEVILTSMQRRYL